VSFAEALISAGPAAEHDDLYGFLVGSWDLEVRRYAGAAITGLTGELHAARVLEGRGVQDTWIMPRERARAEPGRTMYGTTLRIWDPAIAAWRITWINPARNHTEHQVGRAAGPDIVQLGVRPGGTVTRWRFTERTPRSFRWLGETLAPDSTWLPEGEFFATRRA
jgi:hypothetical protein